MKLHTPLMVKNGKILASLACAISIHGQELNATVTDPDRTPLFFGSWTDLDPFPESWN